MAKMIYINKDKDPLRRAQSTQFQAGASHRLAGQIGMSAQYANVQKSFLQLNKDRLNMEWDAYQREKEQNQIIGYVTGAAVAPEGAQKYFQMGQNLVSMGVAGLRRVCRLCEHEEGTPVTAECKRLQGVYGAGDGGSHDRRHYREPV